MKNPALWIALVMGLAAVSVSAQSPTPAAAPSEQKAKTKPDNSQQEACKPATGSHLSRKRGPDGKCEIDPLGGRTYTEEDLRNTGRTTNSEALKVLDPSFK